jgi:hypothetical protein
MLPSYVSSDIKSSAERKVFAWFKDSPGTEDWIVLHSLGIAKHITLIYGEVDFLVLAPGLGIFVLEVKGGRVKRENGIWYFTDKYGLTNMKTRSPFEQASDGVFSIVAALKTKFGPYSKIAKIIFGYGVIFPDILFDDDLIDAEARQVFDKRGSDIVRFIKNLSSNCKKKFTEIYNLSPDGMLPNFKEVNEIARYLRGDFDKPVALQAKMDEIQSSENQATSEQFICLDALEDNPRCLIQGGAGTGKTIMAIEDAFRSIAKGYKVAFLCYNTKLADFLKSRFAAYQDDDKPVFTGTFHSFMLHIIKEAGIITGTINNNPDFWSYEIPLLTLDALKRKPVKFDKIIIDEAQDLINENYLEIFNAVLARGFTRGLWSFFGDFNYQAIYEGLASGKMEELLDSGVPHTKFKLSINCRNTKPICNEITYLTGFQERNYLKKGINGPPVNYLRWQSREEQLVKLCTLLKSLIKHENICPALITILSPLRPEDSIVSEITTVANDYSLSALDIPEMCTIHAFKGLENSIIIITDIGSYSNEKLLYVGLSRAKVSLYILESEQAYEERKAILLKVVKHE